MSMITTPKMKKITEAEGSRKVEDDEVGDNLFEGMEKKIVEIEERGRAKKGKLKKRMKEEKSSQNFLAEGV
jgi:hypothetical protein